MIKIKYDDLPKVLTDKPSESGVVYKSKIGTGELHRLKERAERIGFEFLHIDCSFVEIVDFTGIPDLSEHKLTTPDMFKPVNSNGKIVFFDTIEDINPQCEVFLRTLCKDREISGHILPENVHIVCSTNSTNYFDFLQPLKTFMRS